MEILSGIVNVRRSWTKLRKLKKKGYFHFYLPWDTNSFRKQKMDKGAIEEEEKKDNEMWDQVQYPVLLP